MSNLRKAISACVLLFKQWNYKRRNQSYASRHDRSLLLEPFKLFTHPIRTFDEIKFENRGSLLIANLLLLLYFLQQVVWATAGGYLYNPQAEGNFSLASILAQTVGICMLWTICNWAMCTLTNGIGKVREIWIAVCYSLLPVILIGFICVGLSNVLSMDESVIFSTLQILSKVWTLMLVFLGMMIIHQFSVKKTIMSVIFTLLCIAALLFLLLLLFSVIQQIVGFVSAIIQELKYR